MVKPKTVDIRPPTAPKQARAQGRVAPRPLKGAHAVSSTRPRYPWTTVGATEETGRLPKKGRIPSPTINLPPWHAAGPKWISVLLTQSLQSLLNATAAVLVVPDPKPLLKVKVL